MSASRRLGMVLAALLVLVGAGSAGCSTLPESGSIHRQAADRPTRPQDAPYFNPPGPAKDSTPAAIVSGFLVAMQANPLSTSVARKYLTERARSTWMPNQGTIVYEAFSVFPSRDGARVRLADTRRLDGRGGWRGGTPGSSKTLDLKLVSEQGQWRIDNPVDALVIPTSFFDRSFARYLLYFYDASGRVLIPDPVFVPRGEQTATNLVRGLLGGPGPALEEITRSALPSRTDLDLSVLVTENGVAEVPLSREVLRASPSELSRAVDQLAWTLRQVPGVTRVRITVGGASVPLPSGRVDAPVTSGPQLEAGGTGEPRLWALRGGRVADISPSPKGGKPGERPVEGPLGRSGYSMRSLAALVSPQRIAAVSGSGTAVFVSKPTGESSPSEVTRAVTDATDVLPPSYDMFGDLWLLDRTRQGARVSVLSRGGLRRLAVPGVTGEKISALSVARDGSRLAVAYAGTRPRPVRIVDILRTDEGVVFGAGRSRTYSAGLADEATIVDLGWRDAATVAVLSRPTPETSQVHYVSADGSPTSRGLVRPSLFRGVAQAMVVAPDGEAPLQLITADQQLYTLNDVGTWPRTSAKVTAAAYTR